MKLFALLFGLLIVVFIIMRLHKARFKKKKWVLSILLFTFPLYYWAFALSAQDYNALKGEVLIGAGFILIAYLAYKMKSTASLVLLSIGYIGHAIYDLFHDHLVHNAGTPLWWPEFCITIGLLIGLYILYVAFSGEQPDKRKYSN
ncbi:MAG: hypothetical protein V3U64_00330 [Cocleimonas sp.]